MSQVIVLATSKGGAGKSTLVRSLAGHWLQSGMNVGVIDADPQGSIIHRHDPDGPFKNVGMYAEPEEGVAHLIEELKKVHRPLLVDTGGFRNKTTVRALVAADIAIIPLKPSADDVAGAIETYHLVRELNETPERRGRPLQYRMVLTMSQQGTVIARHVRQELEAQGVLLLKGELYQRVAYPEAAINGLTPSIVDPDGAAARDIAALAAEILIL